MCRKTDPEIKGNIENVVKYIKQSFAKHRIFYGLDTWNERSWEWLERTGNYKTHNTTKKNSITRSVRKDNTIRYNLNRYSVPLGTYNKVEKSLETIDDNHLLVRETKKD